MKQRNLLFIFILLMVSACTSQVEPTPTQASVQVVRELPSATFTPLPTATLEPTPTDTPTATVSPIPTPMEIHTPTSVLVLSLPPTEPTLGSTWLRPADAMMMVYVPGGTFQMGSNVGGDDELPVREVTLDGFWIDQTEVTNAQYARCIAAGNCNGSADGVADHPIVFVSWHDADDYCSWIDGQLPTEAEWEYAARGKNNWIYPWGNDQPDCSISNYNDCVGTTKPVGSYMDGMSWVGAFDMAGNVWEWVRDWYAESYANTSTTNPQGVVSGSNKVYRGGSWLNLKRNIRAANRNNKNPTYTSHNLGFRCVVK